jgi:hypothetical protein
VVQQGKLDILANRQFVDQVEALEDEADVALAGFRQLGFGQAGNFVRVEDIGPVGRAIEHAHDIEQGRLAASGRAHDRDEFAVGDVEVDRIKRRRFDGIGAVRLGQASHGQHGAFPSTRRCRS